MTFIHHNQIKQDFTPKYNKQINSVLDCTSQNLTISKCTIAKIMYIKKSEAVMRKENACVLNNDLLNFSNCMFNFVLNF